MIELRNIKKSYKQGETNLVVLDGLDLTLEDGAFVGISGPSGSGKSTILNIIGCLDRPDSGTVRIDGDDVIGLNDRNLSHLRSSKIGFIFQTFHLIPVLTARENVAWPLSLQNVPRQQRRERADALLDSVGLENHKHKRPSQLSGGQRQRVAIARALVTNPRILMADEPTANLDAVSTLEIIVLLEELNREHGTTLLISTHDDRLATRVKDRLVIDDGKLKVFAHA